MTNKRKNIFSLVIIVLSGIITTSTVWKLNSSEGFSDYTANYEGNTYFKDCVDGNEHNQISYDILDGCSNGQGCNVEENYLQSNSDGIQPLNVSVTNKLTCNSIGSSHGSGRENGYNEKFLTSGCCNYVGYSYTYGTTNIPYYIDASSMTAERAADVRAQIAMWNNTSMYDGTGQIVNFYEVSQWSGGIYPAVKVKQEDLEPNKSGEFNASRFVPTVRLSPDSNVDTPVHEFGHVLGLNDLDVAGDVAYGTHKVLMGYSRHTTSANLHRAIKYQDIQGIAVLNGRHTNHEFTRYIFDGKNYIHFCFYCDMVDSRTSVITGSAKMINESSCTHDYKPMVSSGDILWRKCTKCYKVVEGNTTQTTYSIICKNLMPNLYVEFDTYTYGVGRSEMPKIYYNDIYHQPQEISGFYGWYTSDNFTNRIDSISETSRGDIIVYAKYDYLLSTESYPDTYAVTDADISQQPSFNVFVLLANNYEKIKNTTLSNARIKISVDVWEIDDGYQDFYLFYNNSEVWANTITHGGTGKNSNVAKYEFEINLNISDYKSVDFLKLRFGAHGAFSDTWKFNNLSIAIYYTN